ncbi:hypothetical protein PI125_g20980 [Phytophthora idaei]|nr:hypothetical protein PI125_g20980 [Phytophthora idaei]
MLPAAYERQVRTSRKVKWSSRTRHQQHMAGDMRQRQRLADSTRPPRLHEQEHGDTEGLKREL